MEKIKGGIRVWDFEKNEARNVSEEEAEQGISAGKFGLRKGVEIPVVSPDGTRGTIFTDKAGEAFSKGFRLQRPEQIQSTFDTAKQKAVQEAAGEMPGTAFTQGALKTATLGASDVAVQAFTDVEPEFQKAVAEENPVASTLGEIAGVLPIGTVAPAALIAKGTAAIGGRVAGSQAIKKAAEFAADGLVYGLGESVSDLALGNPDEVASNIIIGGGLGGIIGGTVGSLSPVAKAAKNAILGKAEREIVKKSTGLAEAVAKKKSKSMNIEGAQEFIESGAYREVLDPDKVAKAAADSQAAKEGVAQFTADMAATKNELKSIKKEYLKTLKASKGSIRDENYAAAEVITKKMTDLEKADATQAARIISELQNDVDTVATNLYAEARENLVQKAAAKKSLSVDEEKVVDTFLQDVRTFIDQAKTQTTSYPSEVGDAMANILARADTVTSPEGYAGLMLDLKEVANRNFGRLADGSDAKKATLFIGDSARKGLDSLGLDATNQLRFADQVYRDRSSIRKASKRWRTASEVRDGKPANVADRIVSDLMRSEDSRAGVDIIMNKMDEFFQLVDPEDRAAQSALDTARAKVGQVDASISQRKGAAQDIKLAKKEYKMKKQANQLLREKVRQEIGMVSDAQTIEEMAQLIENMASSSSVKDQAKKAVKMSEIKQFLQENPNLNTIEKYAYISKELGDKNSVKRMEELIDFQKNQALFSRMEGEEASSLSKLAVLGAAVADPTAGATALAVSKALHLANSPKAALEVIPVIEKFAAKGKSAMDAFSTGFARALTSKTLTRATYTPLATSSFGSASEAVTENMDPVKFQEKVAAKLEPLASAPNVQMSLMNKAVRTQQYLSETMPKDPVAGTSLFTPKWSPSEIQKNEWLRRYNIAENPAAIFPKIQDGTITPEEVEALKAVHPELFQQMQKQMVLSLAEAKEPPPYNMLVTLGFIFDMPTDPTLDGAYIGFMQELIANYPKDKPSSNKSLSKLDPTTFMSDNQQVVNR